MALTLATELANYAAGIGTQGATLKIDSANKRVGVGTTNPQGPEGSLQVGTGITFFGNTGIISAIGGKFSGDFTVGGTLTYEDVQNVNSSGVGTFSGGINVVGGGLTVTGVSTFFSGVNAQGAGSTTTTLNVTGVATVGNNISIGDSIFHTGDGGGTTFGFPAANTFTVYTNGSEKLRVASNGHIGINTNDPKTRFHINQSKVANAPVRSAALYLENNANCEIQMVGNPSNDCQVRFGTGGSSFKGAIEYQLDNDALLAYVDGSEKLRITGIGSVGIGENDPKRLLDVFKSSNTTYTPNDFVLHSTARLHNDSTTTDSFASLAFRTGSGDNAIGFKYSGSANQSDFVLVNDGGANGVERLRVASDGDVGIGTDNPITAVHILSTNTGGDLTVERSGDGNSGPEIVLRHTSTSPADDDFIGQIIFSGRDDANNNTTVVRIDGIMTDVTNGSEDGELVFNTRNDGTFAERVRIDSAGRILRGVSSSYANASIDDLQIGSNTSSTQRGLTIGSTDECAIAFADAGDTRAGSITYNHGQDALIIKTEGQNTRLTINRAGGEFTGVCTATQLFEGSTRVASTGKAIAMAMLFG